MMDIFWILVGIGIMIFLVLVGASIFEFLHKAAETLYRMGEITEIIVRKKKKEEENKDEV
jgi:hypothetical protein